MARFGFGSALSARLSFGSARPANQPARLCLGLGSGVLGLGSGLASGWAWARAWAGLGLGLGSGGLGPREKHVQKYVYFIVKSNIFASATRNKSSITARACLSSARFRLRLASQPAILARFGSVVARLGRPTGRLGSAWAWVGLRLGSARCGSARLGFPDGSAWLGSAPKMIFCSKLCELPI